MIFLDLEALLHVAHRTLGAEPEVRDHGLLESALARPQATAFGEDAYPTIHEKAAALLHSLARNHALVDGNKRLALAGTLAFLGMNGLRLTLTNDQAYDLDHRRRDRRARRRARDRRRPGGQHRTALTRGRRSAARGACTSRDSGEETEEPSSPSVSVRKPW